MDDAVTAGTPPAAERELRLGLVLYGGVSLAIYMHGSTKELHRLVRASADLDSEAAGASPGEAAWRDLLTARAQVSGVRTRVVVDCIAGTSAGGINGVYLAKALAHDLSQDALRELWFDRGDIGVLLRGPALLPWRLRAPWVLLNLPRKPVLRGDLMAAWLYDALREMPPASPDGDRSLLPDGHPLRLFVTVTDHGGYPRDVVLADPTVVRELRHRHVLQFRHGDGDDDFGGGGALDDFALAFAARATSCFPGAFPSVDVASFSRALRRSKSFEDDGVDPTGLDERWLFRHHQLAGAAAGDAHLIDGGVLDNRPFRHAIDAIRKAPAGREVERKLLYLEPKPVEVASSSGGGGAPGPLGAVMASLVGLPRHEPILDDILEVARSNERVEQLQDVISASWDSISESVEEALRAAAGDGSLDDPDEEQLAAWREAMHAEAARRMGAGYVTYARVKVSEAVDGWASTVCRLSRFPSDCSQAALVRAVMRTWARDVALLGTPTPELTEAQLAFLRDFDLGYGERHLRFLLAALSWWYDPGSEPDFPVPSRAQLDHGKARLHDLLHRLRAAMRGDDLPTGLRAQIDAIFGAPSLATHLAQGSHGPANLLATAEEGLAELVAGFRAHLAEQLAGFPALLQATVEEIVDGWEPEARRRFRIRHLGYPVWDALLFPLQAVAGVGERDTVDVVRLSPQDATLLQPPTDEKLVGTRQGNFGAFFDRAGREKDYLWGRLDAAERLVGILLADADAEAAPDAREQERVAWCHRLFTAILDEEADALPSAAALISELRGQLAAEQVPSPDG